MKTKYYEDLPHRHIIRKALDQWSREDNAATGASAPWSLPPISSAPKRFREADGFKHMYMSERFFKKTWKTTPDDLVAAGVQFKVSERTKTKAKKFSLFQLYEYVKGAGGMSAREADDAANTEIARIMKSRANYASFKSGGYDDDAADFMYDFY